MNEKHLGRDVLKVIDKIKEQLKKKALSTN